MTDKSKIGLDIHWFQAKVQTTQKPKNQCNVNIMSTQNNKIIQCDYSQGQSTLAYIDNTVEPREKACYLDNWVC